jgi:dynactin-4
VLCKLRQKGCPTNNPKYTFQLAFTNPLYDPIQIRLTQPHAPRNSPPANNHLHIPTQHFTVAAMKDAWAYDDEEEDDPLDGSENASEESSMIGTMSSRRSRMSVLGVGGLAGLRDKKRDTGVERRGNISKVGLEVEVQPEATGQVEVSHMRCGDLSEADMGSLTWR